LMWATSKRQLLDGIHPTTGGFLLVGHTCPADNWLGFESAEYRLPANGHMTRLTRTTTISSHLHPAWYWRGFERLGVESEHTHILRDVARRTAQP